jgi:hypothetical protein
MVTSYKPRYLNIARQTTQQVKSTIYKCFEVFLAFK